MPLTPAICTQCGAQIEVDNSKDAAICPSCGTAFIVEKAINNYVTNHTTINNFSGTSVGDKESEMTNALEHIRMGNVNVADSVFNRLIINYPNYWGGYYGRAVCLTFSKNKEDFKKIAESIKGIYGIKTVYWWQEDSVKICLEKAIKCSDGKVCDEIKKITEQIDEDSKNLNNDLKEYNKQNEDLIKAKTTISQHLSAMAAAYKESDKASRYRNIDPGLCKPEDISYNGEEESLSKKLSLAALILVIVDVMLWINHKYVLGFIVAIIAFLGIACSSGSSNIHQKLKQTSDAAIGAIEERDRLIAELNKYSSDNYFKIDYLKPFEYI